MHQQIRSAILCLLPLCLLPALLCADLPRAEPRAHALALDKLQRIADLLQDSVDRQRVAGASALIARNGKVVYLATAGHEDIEANRPLTEKTIFRIASMTKPITSVAVLMLCDEGKLKLDDPVSAYIPQFKSPAVLVQRNANGAASFSTAPAEREITIHDLLTHTSGISYGFFGRPHLADLYVSAGISDGLVETPGTIGENARRLAALPLLHQPGSAWEYGLSTDVLGHVVEIASGQSLDEFFRERIFRPLRMTDTHFVLPREKRDRFAALYEPAEDQTIRRVGEGPRRAGALVYSATFQRRDDSTYYSGGAGLVSTIGDYARFLQMLLNRGQLEGARLLRPDTVDLMVRDHIAPHRVPFTGHGDGFGYGFGVLTKRANDADPAPVGAYSWGGLFYTYFWVDPRNELVAILMTQTFPSDHLRLREQFKRLTYEAFLE